MSRRGGDVREEIYEERGYYANPTPAPSRIAPVRARDLEEIDVRRERRSGREDPRDRQPDFMRRQYFDDGREQPLVLRKREVETFTRPLERRSPSPTPPPVVEKTRTRVVERVRERSPSPPPAPVERTRTRIVERERERARSYSPEPPKDRGRFSGARATRIVYERSHEQEQEQERSPEPPRVERTRTRIVERERERDRDPRPPSPPVEERVTTRTRITERERPRPRSPSPVVEEERIEITTRRKRRSPSPESSVSPEPESQREEPIIRAPPIHQEIITHHRHIDHGYEYEPRLPPPTPRAKTPPRVEKERDVDIDIHTGRNGTTEIDIYNTKREAREASPAPYRRRERPRREYVDEDILIERDHSRLHIHEERTRARSASGTTRIRGDESEADYYDRKTQERAYIGEAFNGATKDWAIVDVPPGTERVRMDGVGGGSQEVSWQRYNGVRRSKFVPERDTMAIYDREVERERVEIDDRRIALPRAPPKNKYGDMWTEITKDLVIREAIEEMGYDFEETEFFFYVIQYLRFDDVQELVDLTEHIKRERRNRIRQIAYEKEIKEERFRIEEPPHRRHLPEYEDERIIEREIIYEAPYRGGRYR